VAEKTINPIRYDKDIARTWEDVSLKMSDVYVLKGNSIDPKGIKISDGVQLFFDNVAKSGGGVIEIPAGLYRFNQSLKYYPDKLTLISTGDVTFQFEQTTGYCVEIQSYETLYVKDYLAKALTNYVQGIVFKAMNDSVYLFRSKGTGGGTTSKFASGWTFKHCDFIGGSSFEINTDTWAIDINKCYFKPTGGYGVYMPSGGSNYGESIGIEQCIFDSALISAIYNNNGSGDIQLNKCRLDYNHNTINVQHGIVSLDQCFVESSFTDNHHFICETYGATLRFGYLQFTDTANTRTMEIFKVSDDSTDLMGSGIVGETFKLIAGYSTPTFLVKGTGPVDIRKVIEYKDGKKPVISRYLNKLAFGNCDSANSLSEWTTVAGSIAPTIDNTNFFEGTGSMKFSRSTTGSVSIRKVFPIKAGQTIRFKFNIKTSGISGSGLNMSIDRVFLNDVGVTISSGNVLTISADYTNWTEILQAPSIQAPQGCTQVQLTFWAGNWTTTQLAWIDDIVVNII
jgi:hypothetical protein